MKNHLQDEWLLKAESDYISARSLSKLIKRKGLPDQIAFHCQQCVEKYFKAFLQQNNIKFPKTHDLVLLLKLSSQKDSSFELLSDIASELGSFAVESRYPGCWVSVKDARTALKYLEEARDFLKQRMSCMGK